ncbi:MAG: hypothetical protein KC478_09705 [Bacteriovoracaceae bacterium]|nr:hypothetical protein [Bacteriovoracaceae bacterium]
MSYRDLSKEVLYEGVKTLVDTETAHIHLPQQKLYTLFSIGFQYLLYKSTKEAGHYIIRVEDSYLLDKLQKKSKDQSTRRFMQSLALPRKLKYGGSVFHLDFFNFSTWANTNELPKDKIKGALVVKNATKKPFGEYFADDEDEQLKAMLDSLPSDYYYSSLMQVVPKTIVIAYDENYEGVESVRFPFIKEEPKEKLSRGVNIASDVNLDDLEE